MAGVLLNGSGLVPAQYLDLLNLTDLSAPTISTEQILLPFGSTAPAIVFDDPIQCSLSRSGIAQITPGSSQVTVPFPGLSNNSVVLATYHLDSGAALDGTLTAVESVETQTNQFVIHGNAAATAAVKVAWLVASVTP